MSKTITITGASSDIGLAMAKKIACEDDRLLLHYNSRKPSLARSEFKCCDIELVCSDFSNQESLSRFCKEIEKTDVLINNAAVVKTDVLPFLQDEIIERMISVNVTALIKICRAVLPYMSSKRKGVLLNISSVAAHRGNRGQTVYAGTKGFMESFSRSLAAEFGAKGIRVNCIAPGPVESASLKEIMSYAPDQVKDSVLSKRLGRPDDIAELAAFLCSDASEFINGQTVGIDGGFIRGL